MQLLNGSVLGSDGLAVDNMVESDSFHDFESLAAPYPFDHPQADLILRSSDKPPIDFRVFKLLLSLASPFFSVLLTLPQPPLLSPIPGIDHGGAAGISTIQMSEDSYTLEALLSFCYPLSTHPLPHLTSLTHLHTVAQAAVKFEMDGILNHLRSPHVLLAPRFLESQPIRIFAIAYCHNWIHEARLAARYTLRHPVLPATPSFTEELERISAGAYHRLQEYHRLCGESASARVLREEWSDEYDDQDTSWAWIDCWHCQASQSRGHRLWWFDWLKGVANLLLTKPRGETVRNYDLMKEALARASRCWYCAPRAREDLESYIQILSVHVEKEISTVELDIEFIS